MPVTLHRDCLVGANPIIWSNDDFAELAGDVPLGFGWTLVDHVRSLAPEAGGHQHHH